MEEILVATHQTTCTSAFLQPTGRNIHLMFHQFADLDSDTFNKFSTAHRTKVG